MTVKRQISEVCFILKNLEFCDIVILTYYYMEKMS